MAERFDPGPLPAVVEPEPTPVELVLMVSPHLQVGVTGNVDHTGLTGLTLRYGGFEITAPLNAIEVGELVRLLAASSPISLVPAEAVHKALVSHEVEVAWFRRRNGYAWWCSCLTDGTTTYTSPADAHQGAAWHQATQLAEALSAAASCAHPAAGDHNPQEVNR